MFLYFANHSSLTRKHVRRKIIAKNSTPHTQIGIRYATRTHPDPRRIAITVALRLTGPESTHCKTYITHTIQTINTRERTRWLAKNIRSSRVLAEATCGHNLATKEIPTIANNGKPPDSLTIHLTRMRSDRVNAGRI